MGGYLIGSLGNRVRGHGMGIFWLRIGLGAGCYEHCSEPWGFIKCTKFLN
jgi:hypothetical protein